VRCVLSVQPDFLFSVPVASSAFAAISKFPAAINTCALHSPSRIPPSPVTLYSDSRDIVVGPSAALSSAYPRASYSSSHCYPPKQFVLLTQLQLFFWYVRFLNFCSSALQLSASIPRSQLEYFASSHHPGGPIVLRNSGISFSPEIPIHNSAQRSSQFDRLHILPTRTQCFYSESIWTIWA